MAQITCKQFIEVDFDVVSKFTYKKSIKVKAKIKSISKLTFKTVI